MLSQAHTMPSGASLSHPDSYFTMLYRTLRARYVAYKTRQALLGLTARELDDIGLVAGDIDHVSRRSAGL